MRCTINITIKKGEGTTKAVGKATSVIEINGASYDVRTGRAIGSKHQLASTKLIDGFMKRPARRPTKKAATKAQTPTKKKARQARTVATTSAALVHRRTERSKTLVRNAVVRPSLTLKSAVSNIAKPVSNRLSLESSRIARAAQIQKHTAVNRFGTLSPGKILPKAGSKPLRVRPRALNSATAAMAEPQTPSSHQRLERMLDEALTNADAHKQLIKRHRYSRTPFKAFLLRPKWLQIIILTVVIVIAAVIVVWRFVPQASVSLAAHRAHINAGLSSYTPAGYKFNKVSATANGINVEYRSADSASNYSVQEVKTSADSSSAAANTISKGTSVQTSQVNGSTVYIYGPKDNVMWVNNGVEFSIINNAGLSSQQLLQIVQGF